MWQSNDQAEQAAQRFIARHWAKFNRRPFRAIETDRDLSGVNAIWFLLEHLPACAGDQVGDDSDRARLRHLWNRLARRYGVPTA